MHGCARRAGRPARALSRGQLLHPVRPDTRRPRARHGRKPEGPRDRHAPPGAAAMADGHGSQCGFCTPGFVMSLFALYKSSAAPDRVGINDALAGNLCRCTGYRPIVDAAQAMYALGDAISPTGQSWLTASARSRSRAAAKSEAELAAKLKALKRRRGLVLPHASGTFYSPRSSRRPRGGPRAPPGSAHPRGRHRRRPLGDEAAPRSRRHHLPRQRRRPAGRGDRCRPHRHRRRSVAHRRASRASKSTTPSCARCCAASPRRRSATPARSAATSPTGRRSATRCRR